jgi:hypothetical protein
MDGNNGREGVQGKDGRFEFIVTDSHVISAPALPPLPPLPLSRSPALPLSCSPALPLSGSPALPLSHFSLPPSALISNFSQGNILDRSSKRFNARVLSYSVIDAPSAVDDGIFEPGKSPLLFFLDPFETHGGFFAHSVFSHFYPQGSSQPGGYLFAYSFFFYGNF